MILKIKYINRQSDQSLRLITNDNKEICVHFNHSIPDTLDEINEDVWPQFIVYEHCTNHPILHGISAPSACDALQEVHDILVDEGGNVPILNGVDQLEFI